MKSTRQDAIYLNLFHGRKKIEEDMDDWGTQGPTFKLNGIYSTYGWQLKLDVDDTQNDMIAFELVDGMVIYDGVAYGDWFISARLDDGFVVSELDVTKMNK